MTIHKSKGLEFPICYFAGFSSKFNTSELKEKIIFDNKYGFILPYVNESYKDTILKTLLKYNLNREEISEKIRLLYVAVTRCKEKMIIVMPKVEEESEVFDIVDIYRREKYNSFLSIMKSIYSNLLNYVTETTVIGTKDYLNNIKTHSDNLKLNKDDLKVSELNLLTEEVEEKHYSKEKLELMSTEEKELMEIGTEIHKVLEEINFTNYNLDTYDISNFAKKKITNFINSNFMSKYLDKEMYKEYEFVYLEDNKLNHGIIDLLIDNTDDYVIVDYKLKNIDDSSYDKQLNGYKKYIEEKTKKKATCYLYSLFDEKFREV